MQTGRVLEILDPANAANAGGRGVRSQPAWVATVRTMTVHTGEIQIGRVVISLETASTWIREYTNAARNLVGERPYAFPAYDCYDGGTTEPGRLTDGDLLAPGLLNVPVKIRSFYGLQLVRGQLEAALMDPVLEKPLAEIAAPAELRPVVRALYEVLDDAATRPWGVGGTTLSKVLHRKRPYSVVLHDRWVRACYVGNDAPVPSANGRSWGDYMVLITDAIWQDIVSQPAAFSVLRGAVGAPGHLSDVRLLDILAWSSKGDARATASDEHPFGSEESTDLDPESPERLMPVSGNAERERGRAVDVG